MDTEIHGAPAFRQCTVQDLPSIWCINNIQACQYINALHRCPRPCPLLTRVQPSLLLVCSGLCVHTLCGSHPRGALLSISRMLLTAARRVAHDRHFVAHACTSLALAGVRARACGKDAQRPQHALCKLLNQIASSNVGRRGKAEA